MKYVLVTGCQRSGTTLTGQMMGAQPRAVLIDEDEGLYPWLDALLAGDVAEQQLKLQQCLSASMLKYRQPLQRFTVTGTVQPDITHLVLKAPNAVYDYPELQLLAKRVSVIFLTRDVRDVVSSMRRLKHIPMVDNQLQRMRSKPHIRCEFSDEIALLEDACVADYIKMAVIWKVKTMLLYRFRQAGLDPLAIRYEDMVRQPGMFTQKMTAHAGLPDDALCNNHHHVYTGSGPGGTDRTRSVDVDSISGWSHALSDDEENGIWQVAGSLMQQLGYHRSEVVCHG